MPNIYRILWRGAGLGARDGGDMLMAPVVARMAGAIWRVIGLAIADMARILRGRGADLAV